MAPPGYYGDEEDQSVPHDSSPYETTIRPQAAPPPPAHHSGPHGSEAAYNPMPPTTARPMHAPALDIEAAIAHEVQEGIDDAKSFGTSILRGVKNYLVPVGTVMDILSASLRILTVGFLIVMPDVYDHIYNPPVNSGWIIAHVVILTVSILGIALGQPVSIFSSVYNLVTINGKLDATEQIKVRKVYLQRRKYFRRKQRAAWRYIGVAFLAGVALGIPYFLAHDPRVNPATKQLITEAVFIVIPFVTAIITMITEREAGADGQERASRMGTNLGLYQTFMAGMRLAAGAGTTRDAASVHAAMNADIGGAIDAGVMIDHETVYVTLSEIAVMLGRPGDKAHPFRRTLSNVCAAKVKTGEWGIIPDKKKGYLVPKKYVLDIFAKYVPQAVEKRGNVVEIRSKWNGPAASSEADQGRNTVERNVIARIVRAIWPDKKTA